MFNFFKKKTDLEKLYDEYDKLMSEGHKLSTVNRTLSDQKYSAANEILSKINLLKKDAKN